MLRNSSVAEQMAASQGLDSTELISFICITFNNSLPTTQEKKNVSSLHSQSVNDV
jgi:hypothetical protein